MSDFFATTTVSILRGTAVDDYLDELDATTTVATGIRAAIVERQVVDLTATGDQRTPRRITGRFALNVDLRDGDRLRDERTGVIYAVNTATAPVSFTGTSSIRLDLDRAT